MLKLLDGDLNSFVTLQDRPKAYPTTHTPETHSSYTCENGGITVFKNAIALLVLEVRHVFSTYRNEF